VGPSYVVRSSPSRSISSWSLARPEIDVGRVCGTSASSAPSVRTSFTPSSPAAVTTALAKLRQRSDGSTPCTNTRSRSAVGMRAAVITVAGQSIVRAWPSTSRTVGRTAVKSKNSSGSIRAISTASKLSTRNPSAADADSPASFQPLNAQTRTGSRSTGLSVQMSGSTDSTVAEAASCVRRPFQDAPVEARVRTTVAELRPGAEVDGPFACTRKERLTARNGSGYLALELRDRSGTITARAFREADFLAGQFERGELVHVRGRVERFRDELQIEVSEIRRAEGDLDPAEFLPSAYRDLDELDGFLEHLA